jgi:hypothetical protein
MIIASIEEKKFIDYIRGYKFLEETVLHGIR